MPLLAIAIIAIVLAICIFVFGVLYRRRQRRDAAGAERLPAHESHGIVPVPESSDQSADGARCNERLK
jgi:uncharacterized SAM-binding protein YcdF (DUF218 family)